MYRNVQETYFDIVRILLHTAAAAAAYLSEWCQCVVDVIWRRGWCGRLGGELTQLGEGRGEGEGEEGGGGGIYISNPRYLLFKVVTYYNNYSERERSALKLNIVVRGH